MTDADVVRRIAEAHFPPPGDGEPRLVVDGSRTLIRTASWDWEVEGTPGAWPTLEGIAGEIYEAWPDVSAFPGLRPRGFLVTNDEVLALDDDHDTRQLLAQGARNWEAIDLARLLTRYVGDGPPEHVVAGAGEPSLSAVVASQEPLERLALRAPEIADDADRTLQFFAWHIARDASGSERIAVSSWTMPTRGEDAFTWARLSIADDIALAERTDL